MKLSKGTYYDMPYHKKVKSIKRSEKGIIEERLDTVYVFHKL